MLPWYFAPPHRVDRLITMKIEEDVRQQLDRRIQELEREIRRLEPIERTWFQRVVQEKRSQLDHVLHQRELLGD